MNLLDVQLEAILFWKGEPIALKKLAHIVQKEIPEVTEGLKMLESKLSERGLTLIYKDEEVMLGTAPAMSAMITELTKEELTRDLGKAGLEALSIVIYQGPISRGEIDYIRGVNSNFIVRNLLIRGLIEKVTNEKDARSFLYRPTFELLQYLGVSKTEDLPDYHLVRKEIEQFKHEPGVN